MGINLTIGYSVMKESEQAEYPVWILPSFGNPPSSRAVKPLHTTREDNGLVAGRSCASMRCVRPRSVGEKLPLALENPITFTASFGFAKGIYERMRL